MKNIPILARKTLDLSLLQAAWNISTVYTYNEDCETRNEINLGLIYTSQIIGMDVNCFSSPVAKLGFSYNKITLAVEVCVRIYWPRLGE